MTNLTNTATPAAMNTYDLTGRTALITGASQGLGLAIAKRFAASGADLFLCARGAEVLAKAVESVKNAAVRKEQKVFSAAADVSKPEEVSALTNKVLAAFPQLTILVSNAGVYGPMGKIEDVDFDSFRQAVEINLLGPVLMVQSLLKHFRRSSYGKIIQISGGGATNPLPRLEAYAASKAAVVRFMESLALDLREDHVDVNSVAPGLLDTRLLDQVLANGPEAVGSSFFEKMKASKQQGQCTDLEIGAKLCQFLASAASDGLTGKLISAVWDAYEAWPSHLEELNSSDIYTLRRITGRDRGSNWGDK
jgi:NAD(P)-dependent dehydrogenase (short-subunit alcohol dehydrogenase family)